MHVGTRTRFGVLLVSVVLMLAAAGPASAAIRFDRLSYDAPGKDTGKNAHLNQEFVRLVNTGDTRRNLGGWRVRDRVGHVFVIPDGFRLGPGRVVRIHTGKGVNDGNDLYWRSGWYIWNNDADRATLKNRAGDVKDRCAYDDGSTRENRLVKVC